MIDIMKLKVGFNRPFFSLKLSGEDGNEIG